MSDISLVSLVLFVLWVPGGCRNVPELPSVEGQYAEMDCGAEQRLEANRTVTWLRRREGGDRVLAQFSTGPGGRPSRRWSVLHSERLYLILRDVTAEDLGSYTCVGQAGRTTQAMVLGTTTCTSGFGMTTLNTTDLTLQHLPTVPQAGNTTQTPLWCMREFFVSACSGVGYALYRGQHQGTHLLMKGTLPQGYGISLQRGATLVISRVAEHHAGTYVCRMGNTVYKVKLQVLRPGILHSVSGIWIILVTVFVSLTLYILSVGLMVSFHRKQRHRTHAERISRIMGSLFRHRPELDVRFSEPKASGTELNGTMVRDASCSTNYENLGSRENLSPGDQCSLSEHLEAEIDAAQSYENLCEDGDADDDDYLDPAGEDASINTEGPHSERLNGPSVYAIPNKGPKLDQASAEGGTGLRVSSWDTEAPPVQVEGTTGDGGSSEEDYAVPDAETALKLTMDTSGTYTNHYMKMCAARNMSQRDMLTNVEGSSAEESVMMERCRKLFMMKFQSNASRYSSQDEAGGSLKTLPRVKNPHVAAFSVMDRMATLPE